MKRFFKACILGLSLLFCGVSTSGCTGFFSKNLDANALHIKEITSETLEDGSIVVTINYLETDKEPVVFTIPCPKDGRPGADGISIQSVEYETSADNTKTIVTIYYTDEAVDPTVIELPHGVSISGIKTQYNDETNETTVVVEYSDGTSSDPFILPGGRDGEPGKDGEDGNGITGVDQVENDDGSIKLTFHFSKSNDVEVLIPAPKQGETGRGISSIVSSENDYEYIMVIQYTDGDEEELKWTRPTNPNQWYSGGGVPDDDTGKNGDYYFDIAHGKIYIKQDDSWQIIIDLRVEVKTYTVRFHLNDEDGTPAKMPDKALLEYRIEGGSYFAAQGNYPIPIPTRTGYTFEGWYTSKLVTPTSGKFTDLTPILDDLDLYASWTINN